MCIYTLWWGFPLWNSFVTGQSTFHHLTSTTHTVKHFSNGYLIETWLYPHSSHMWNVFPRGGYVFSTSPINCTWFIKTDNAHSAQEWGRLCEANGLWWSSKTDSRITQNGATLYPHFTLTSSPCWIAGYHSPCKAIKPLLVMFIDTLVWRNSPGNDWLLSFERATTNSATRIVL